MTSDPFQAYLRNDSNPHLISTPVKIITGSKLKAIQPTYNFYWRPREPNFKGIDAVIGTDSIIWALQFTISASHGSATGGLTKVSDIMNHRTGVEWRLVMVGPKWHVAKSTRYSQVLGSRWKEIPVYACELPFCEFTDDQRQRLQDTLDEANDTYPVDQGADSDVIMN